MRTWLVTAPQESVTEDVEAFNLFELEQSFTGLFRWEYRAVALRIRYADLRNLLATIGADATADHFDVTELVRLALTRAEEAYGFAIDGLEPMDL